MTGLRRLFTRRALLWCLAATLVMVAADRALAVRHGLEATYFGGPDWRSDAGTVSTVDARPSTELLKSRHPDFERRPFSVEWRGYVVIPVGGAYTFRTVSDDGSWVYLQGQLVVDNAGPHQAREASGTIQLPRGVTPIFIRYSQETGDAVIELSWSREGGPFEPVPSWALVPDRVWYGRVLAGRLTGFLLIGLAISTYILAMGLVLPAAARAGRRFIGVSGGSDPAFRWLLVLSTLLNAWGLWWALPNVRGWAPDEVAPEDVVAAVHQLFSHGWAGKYPPFHYMVLAAADSPLLLLSQLGLIDPLATVPNLLLGLIGRLVSVACGAGTIAAVYWCGVELYDRRGARFAALTMALTLPFAYHAGVATVDVPYLFWFSVSLLAYVRILRHHARQDYVLFAVSAALAGCTKDQAWGLCALVPFALLAARWQRWRREGGPAATIVFDRTVALAVAAGAVAFVLADNLLFNFAGFLRHVHIVFGMPTVLNLHEFPASLSGELRMAWRAVQEMRYMFGWPLAVIVAVSVVRGLADSTSRVSLRWLLVPAISYYVVFLALVLFIVDRYLMPITLVLSLFAGWWLSQFVAPGTAMRRGRLALVSAAFAYSFLYAAAVDYQLTTDSRYAVTRWLHEHVQPNQVIASLGPLEYLAIADGFDWRMVDSTDDVEALKPAFVVIKADQIPASSDQARAMHDALVDGRAGYRLALSYRAPTVPLPGVHPDLGRTPRRGVRDFSDLNMINPTMEIFERTNSPGGAPRD